MISLSLFECWINDCILKVDFHKLLTKSQLVKFLKVDNFKIIYSCQNNDIYSFYTTYLQFDNYQDAFKCLFKNGMHDFKIEIFSIFNNL